MSSHGEATIRDARGDPIRRRTRDPTSIAHFRILGRLGPGRHGGRLPRRGRDPAAHGRPEAAARHRRRQRGPPALPARGPLRGFHHPPQRRHHPPGRRGRRSPVHRDGAGGRREPPHPARVRPARRGDGSRSRHPGGPRPRRGAREGDRAPRSQARERDDHGDGGREAARLRPRQDRHRAAGVRAHGGRAGEDRDAW